MHSLSQSGARKPIKRFRGKSRAPRSAAAQREAREEGRKAEGGARRLPANSEEEERCVHRSPFAEANRNGKPPINTTASAKRTHTHPHILTLTPTSVLVLDLARTYEETTLCRAAQIRRDSVQGNPENLKYCSTKLKFVVWNNHLWRRPFRSVS